MGDVINLNKMRKARAKDVARTTATENRARFGRTKAEKDREKLEKARTDRLIDGAKIESP